MDDVGIDYASSDFEEATRLMLSVSYPSNKCIVDLISAAEKAGAPKEQDVQGKGKEKEKERDTDDEEKEKEEEEGEHEQDKQPPSEPPNFAEIVGHLIAETLKFALADMVLIRSQGEWFEGYGVTPSLRRQLMEAEFTTSKQSAGLLSALMVSFMEERSGFVFGLAFAGYRAALTAYLDTSRKNRLTHNRHEILHVYSRLQPSDVCLSSSSDDIEKQVKEVLHRAVSSVVTSYLINLVQTPDNDLLERIMSIFYHSKASLASEIVSTVLQFTRSAFNVDHAQAGMYIHDLMYYRSNPTIETMQPVRYAVFERQPTLLRSCLCKTDQYDRNSSFGAEKTSHCAILRHQSIGCTEWFNVAAASRSFDVRVYSMLDFTRPATGTPRAVETANPVPTLAPELQDDEFSLMSLLEDVNSRRRSFHILSSWLFNGNRTAFSIAVAQRDYWYSLSATARAKLIDLGSGKPHAEPPQQHRLKSVLAVALVQAGRYLQHSAMTATRSSLCLIKPHRVKTGHPNDHAVVYDLLGEIAAFPIVPIAFRRHYKSVARYMTLAIDSVDSFTRIAMEHEPKPAVNTVTAHRVLRSALVFVHRTCYRPTKSDWPTREPSVSDIEPINVGGLIEKAMQMIDTPAFSDSGLKLLPTDVYLTHVFIILVGHVCDCLSEILDRDPYYVTLHFGVPLEIQRLAAVTKYPVVSSKELLTWPVYWAWSVKQMCGITVATNAGTCNGVRADKVLSVQEMTPECADKVVSCLVRQRSTVVSKTSTSSSDYNLVEKSFFEVHKYPPDIVQMRGYASTEEFIADPVFWIDA